MVRLLPAQLLLVCSTLFWSGNFVIGRALHDSIPPLSLAFWRWTLALCLILPFTLVPLWRQRQLILAHWPILLLLGVLGVAGFNTFVYLGLQHTSATNALLINSAIPIFIILISRLLLGQRLNGRQHLGVVLSLLGVVTLILQGSWSHLLELRSRPGDLWILLAALNWASYSVLLRWKPAALQALPFLGVTIIVGLSILAPLHGFDLLHEPDWPVNALNLGGILYVALFASVLAFLGWNEGVKRIGAPRAGQFVHLMPVFGTLIAVLFLHETLQGYHLIGASLIALGIALSQIAARRSQS